MRAKRASPPFCLLVFLARARRRGATQENAASRRTNRPTSSTRTLAFLVAERERLPDSHARRARARVRVSGLPHPMGLWKSLLVALGLAKKKVRVEAPSRTRDTPHLEAPSFVTVSKDAPEKVVGFPCVSLAKKKRKAKRNSPLSLHIRTERNHARCRISRRTPASRPGARLGEFR